MARLTATTDPLVGLRAAALNLLARREHSTLELRHKLARRGFDADQIAAVLGELQQRGWQDDGRFAEAYAVNRAERGYGPLRIRIELRERGIADHITERALTELADLWSANLERLHRKRFGAHLPADAAERARRQRFLRQRGFTTDQIKRLFRPE